MPALASSRPRSIRRRPVPADPLGDGEVPMLGAAASGVTEGVSPGTVIVGGSLAISP